MLALYKWPVVPVANGYCVSWIITESETKTTTTPTLLSLNCPQTLTINYSIFT